MRHPHQMIWIAGLVIIGLINLWGAQPRMYKGVAHAVGSDVVWVYAPTDEQGELTVPVVTSGDLTETGARVQVYLRYAYKEKDEEVLWCPRATLWVMAGCLLASVVAWAIGWWRARRT
jgi:hypothetical protein